MSSRSGDLGPRKDVLVVSSAPPVANACIVRRQPRGFTDQDYSALGLAKGEGALGEIASAPRLKMDKPGHG